MKAKKKRKFSDIQLAIDNLRVVGQKIPTQKCIMCGEKEHNCSCTLVEEIFIEDGDLIKITESMKKILDN